MNARNDDAADLGWVRRRNRAKTERPDHTRFRVVAINATGRRTVLCAQVLREEALDVRARHRPHALLGGGDVVVEAENSLLGDAS